MNEKTILIKKELNADIKTCWNSWISESEVKKFFSPNCLIEPKPGGKYEIHFDMDAPEGIRGSEGCKILALEKYNLISFTWNAPPHLRNVRGNNTVVILRFKETGKNRTELTFQHIGWGESEEWEAAYNYFINAWNNIVFPRYDQYINVIK